MGKPTIDELADAMYEMVKEATGRKKLKPMDLIKAAKDKFGDENVDKKDGKKAINKLIDEGRCVYTYFGGSFVELPHKDGAANE